MSVVAVSPFRVIDPLLARTAVELSSNPEPVWSLVKPASWPPRPVRVTPPLLVFAIKFFGPPEARSFHDKPDIPDALAPLVDEASPTNKIASEAVLEFVIER